MFVRPYRTYIYENNKVNAFKEIIYLPVYRNIYSYYKGYGNKFLLIVKIRNNNNETIFCYCGDGDRSGKLIFVVYENN